MDAFDKILAVIGRHAKGSDTALETLTRLFRKNQSDKTLPSLDRSNVRCWEDTRAKPWFCGLCNNVETGEVASHDSGHSIVVLVRNGKEFILDGHKRCRLWHKRREQDNHTALFIEPLSTTLALSFTAPLQPDAAMRTSFWRWLWCGEGVDDGASHGRERWLRRTAGIFSRSAWPRRWFGRKAIMVISAWQSNPCQGWLDSVQW